MAKTRFFLRAFHGRGVLTSFWPRGPIRACAQVHAHQKQAARIGPLPNGPLTVVFNPNSASEKLTSVKIDGSTSLASSLDENFGHVRLFRTRPKTLNSVLGPQQVGWTCGPTCHRAGSNNNPLDFSIPLRAVRWRSGGTRYEVLNHSAPIRPPRWQGQISVFARTVLRRCFRISIRRNRPEQHGRRNHQTMCRARMQIFHPSLGKRPDRARLDHDLTAAALAGDNGTNSTRVRLLYLHRSFGKPRPSSAAQFGVDRRGAVGRIADRRSDKQMLIRLVPGILILNSCRIITN